MGQIRAIYVSIAFLALTLPLMLVQLFLASKRLPWLYHRMLTKILGMSIAVEGALPPEPALIVSNHLSWLDIPLLSVVKPVSFIAKREVRSWPLFGAMAKLQHTVFIDRERRLTTGEKRNEIAMRLQAGDTLVLFPEGTSSDGASLLPIKSSYFGAVQDLDIPVIPITITYRPDIKFYAWHGDMDLLPHLWKVLKSGPLKAQITIHPALEKADRKTMAQAAERVIRTALHGGGEIR